MELTDLLTETDKQAYAAYLKKCFKHDIEPDVEKSLKYWNKNKRTLYRALGKQLRVSIPIEVQKDDQTMVSTLIKIYRTPSVVEGIQNLHDDEFPSNFLKYLTLEEYNVVERRDISYLFDYHRIASGILPHDFKFRNYSVKSGAKVMRVISKIVQMTKYPNTEMFESWKNKISDFRTQSKIKANLVLSIHPLDFLSLSDNNCGWSSCYNLLKEGMHREATITHMNSNVAIVAYLESSTPFKVEGFRIPNKSYRQLFYLHKDILAGGRSYPYYNNILAKKILDILKDMVYNNLKWEYKYGLQEYTDLMREGDNTTLRVNDFRFHRMYEGKHNILFTIGYDSGYNDFIEHKDESFYCYKNYVDKAKRIYVTGPRTCWVCGEKTYNRDCVCDKCLQEHYQCDQCNNPHITRTYTIDLYDGKTITICGDCLENYLYVKELNSFMDKSYFNHIASYFDTDHPEFFEGYDTIHTCKAIRAIRFPIDEIRMQVLNRRKIVVRNTALYNETIKCLETMRYYEVGTTIFKTVDYRTEGTVGR